MDAEDVYDQFVGPNRETRRKPAHETLAWISWASISSAGHHPMSGVASTLEVGHSVDLFPFPQNSIVVLWLGTLGRDEVEAGGYDSVALQGQSSLVSGDKLVLELTCGPSAFS